MTDWYTPSPFQGIHECTTGHNNVPDIRIDEYFTPTCPVTPACTSVNQMLSIKTRKYSAPVVSVMWSVDTILYMITVYGNLSHHLTVNI